ncbi:MAG: SpoIID/LytB domain-containing protein [Candidatus Levyibacteriota bacterium]
MRKIFSVSILILFLLSAIFFVQKKAYSDELDDISKKIADLSAALSSSQRATAPFLTQLASMKTQLDGITAQVANTEADIAQKKKIIDQGYINLEKQKILFNKTVRAYYIKNYLFSPLLIFLSSSDAQDATRLIAYQKKGSEDDKAIITNIALTIVDLEARKAALEQEDARLQVVKQKLAAEKADVQKLVDGAVAYQQTLSGQIAVLSARQQSILSQRLASLNIPQSAYAGIGGGCSSDLTNGKNPGFSPRFGFFTYGVPNRVGLNQYGAKGRAEAGQNATQILQAYYNADLTSGYNQGVNIHVVGTNEYGQSFDTNWNIEDYVKHVYEVPADWPSESLKAQAIAARSYALAYTNNGSGNICPSQQCQVVKQELNAQSWIDAVNATAGQVLTNGGNPIKAWFSSTHGGYVYSSGDIGWSATAYTKSSKDTSTDSINSFDDLKNNAYDKNSPWFYCDWGARSDYGGTAWLKGDEIADMANVLVLATTDSSTREHLYQPDKPNPAGTDTWDAGRVRTELQSRGKTAFSSVSNISVDWDKGSGRTTTVSISGDAGTLSFSGSDFKTYFNLRAPANIQIVGPLFNVEKQ